jgi:hypothetical protein
MLFIIIPISDNPKVIDIAANMEYVIMLRIEKPNITLIPKRLGIII